MALQEKIKPAGASQEREPQKGKASAPRPSPQTHPTCTREQMHANRKKDQQEKSHPAASCTPSAQFHVATLQVATAISLHKLFGLEADPGKELMNVICKMDGHLISLLVDDIGDVVEVDNTSYEPTPITIHGAVRKFMLRVHKTDHNLLSVLDIEEIGNSLNQGEA